MKEKNDISYIEQVLEGHSGSFAYLIDRHKDKAFNIAFRICGNREEAEEVAQDAFPKAFNSLRDFKKKSSFSTWLYRIVYNTSVSLVRTRKKRILSLEEFPADAVDFLSGAVNEDDAVENYRNSLVSFALQKLPEDERGLVTLYYYDELGTDEIALITGIKKQNIKVRLFRARQKMADIIKSAEKKNVLYHE